MDFLSRIRLGINAFAESYVTSSPVDTSNWSEQKARILRYDIAWAQYEQSSYRNIHNWAESYCQKYGLYKYIRPIYNPAFRTGEFYKTHIYGGQLMVDASAEGAIPIETDNARLRAAIAELWKWSRWYVQKDILAVNGTILGDAIIQVIDDTTRGKVYLDIVHPGIFESIERDPFGNIKGYVIRESRPDPRGSLTDVLYTEKVSRDGNFVLYETFLNGEPYAWPGNVRADGEVVSEWAEPYGFVPMVAIQHNDVGLEWGWSEIHPIRSKVMEVDDLASQVSDQVRKTIDPVWLMKGMKKAEVKLEGAEATTDRPDPGREELQAIWNLDAGASAEAMVAVLDLENVLGHINYILKEIERDLPELAQDIYTASGDASGRALRTARQPVTSKVIQRRAGYDAGLIAAQQMAVSIGGFRGYDGYKGFDLDSYAKGDLEHSITNRPVFDEDPLDRIEIDAAFWSAAEKAKKAGVPLEAFLREAGWEDDRIAKLKLEEPIEQAPVILPEGDPNDTAV